MTLPSLLFSLVLLLGLAAPSGAVVLATPFLGVGTGQVVTCALTNTGTRPVTITAIDLINFVGGDVVPTVDNCSELPALQPRVTCNVTAPVNNDVYCSFDVQGSQVRAAGIIQAAGSPFTIADIVPATK
jgi:hypothetical protein